MKKYKEVRAFGPIQIQDEGQAVDVLAQQTVRNSSYASVLSSRPSWPGISDFAQVTHAGAKAALDLSQA